MGVQTIAKLAEIPEPVNLTISKTVAIKLKASDKFEIP